MATTTTWSIQWMQTSTQEINGFNEVVLTVGWNLEGTDGTYTYNIYNTATLTPPQAGDPAFTPYANLTQDQVLGWVWETVNQADVEASVTAQVANLANPPVVQPPLPWATGT